AARWLPGCELGDPGGVLTQLNAVFPMERQNDKYFTMFYGVYRPADRTLRHSNAGHPAGLFFPGPAAEGLRELDSVGPGVGMVPDFPFETETAEVPVGARLLVYSDGVYEIAQPAGPMWPSRESTAPLVPLAAASGPVIDDHLAFVRRLHGNDVLGDDFSFLDVRFGAAEPAKPPRRGGRAAS